jgi:hypothetical protein
MYLAFSESPVLVYTDYHNIFGWYDLLQFALNELRFPAKITGIVKFVGALQKEDWQPCSP